MKSIQKIGFTAAVLSVFTTQAFAAEMSSPRDIIWQGLLGAGVGAVSAEASGGKAGKGALIGAGTNVIGGALLNVLTQPSQTPQASYVPSYNYASYAPAPQPVQRPVVYQQPVVYYQQPVYRQPDPVYVQNAPSYYYAQAPQAPAADTNRRIIGQGLMGAGVGAISSYASGGKGGQGALIGAGTNVIGSALLELLTQQ